MILDWSKMIFEYARVKIKVFPAFSMNVDIRSFLHYLYGLIMINWIPLDHNFGGFGYKPLTSLNAIVVFPVIFICFIFRKSDNFWEFSLKWLIIIYLIYRGLTEILPYLASLTAFISAKTTTVFTMYKDIYPLQVALIAIYISKMGASGMTIKSRLGRALQWFIALFLVCFYGILALSCTISIFTPDVLIRLGSYFITHYVPHSLAGHSKELISEVLLYNVAQFQDLMHWHTALFYISTIVIVAPFLKDKWLAAVGKLPKLLIAATLVINAILYSWSMYPLNKEPLFWQSGSRLNYQFNATDRFYYVKEKTKKGPRLL